MNKFLLDSLVHEHEHSRAPSVGRPCGHFESSLNCSNDVRRFHTIEFCQKGRRTELWEFVLDAPKSGPA